jgi:hypothetical protein
VKRFEQYQAYSGYSTTVGCQLHQFFGTNPFLHCIIFTYVNIFLPDKTVNSLRVGIIFWLFLASNTMPYTKHIYWSIDLFCSSVSDCRVFLFIASSTFQPIFSLGLKHWPSVLNNFRVYTWWLRHVVIHSYGVLDTEYLVRNAATKYFSFFLVGNVIFFYDLVSRNGENWVLFVFF